MGARGLERHLAYHTPVDFDKIGSRSKRVRREGVSEEDIARIVRSEEPRVAILKITQEDFRRNAMRLGTGGIEALDRRCFDKVAGTTYTDGVDIAQRVTEAKEADNDSDNMSLVRKRMRYA